MKITYTRGLYRTGICILIFSTVLFALISCHKNSAKPDGADATVYIAGFLGTPGLTTYGTYWKNTQAINIPNASELTSIAVADTDVYVLGGRSYWRNGVQQAITDDWFSSSIHLSGSDVYIVAATSASSALGYQSTAAAVYYKNGTWVNLSQGYSNVAAARITGIAISGNDVYCSAYFQVGNDTVSAAYWKNGTLTWLPNGYMTAGIAVSGSDVYVAGGSLRNGDVYWKNGNMQTLGPSPAIVKCITVSGSDVYVGGTTYGQNHAVYWKNGVEVDLSGGYTVNDMAVVGSDVYAAGNANGGYAVWWKNGVVDTLGIGGADAITVVSK